MYILCGPIGCGKSTLAREKANQGCIVTNDDAIVTMVHGGNYSLYNKMFKPLYKGVEHNILSHAMCLGLDVVIDRTNMSRSMRSRYIAIAKAFDYSITCYLWEWPEPIVSARSRFNAENRGSTFETWLEAATRHHKQYQEPSLDEGINEIIRIERDYATSNNVV